MQYTLFRRHGLLCLGIRIKGEDDRDLRTDAKPQSGVVEKSRPCENLHSLKIIKCQ